MSDCYIEDRECDCDECEDCNCNIVCERPRKHLKPNRTILKCGSQGGVTIPLATVAGAEFTLTTVSVDTKALKNPCIKLEFASNIVTTAAVITLNFQVFKQCKDMLTPIPVGPIWTFSRLVAITEANTFTFFVCDCDLCNDDCCTYSVVARVAGVATVGVTSINHASLSAIIVDNDCNSCK